MRVKTGCGCMTVQTGARVLAGLSIILSIIGIIVVAVVLNNPDLQRDWDAQYKEEQLKGIFVSCIFGFVMSSGFAGLMIYGSVRREPGWVFPYVALGFSGLVNLVLVCIAFVIIAGIMFPIDSFLLLTLLFVSWTVLQVYFWMIMYTHYKDLSAEKYGCQKNPNDGKVFSQPMNSYHNV